MITSQINACCEHFAGFKFCAVCGRRIKKPKPERPHKQRELVRDSPDVAKPHGNTRQFEEWERDFVRLACPTFGYGAVAAHFGIHVNTLRKLAGELGALGRDLFRVNHEELNDAEYDSRVAEVQSHWSRKERRRRSIQYRAVVQHITWHDLWAASSVGVSGLHTPTPRSRRDVW